MLETIFSIIFQVCGAVVLVVLVLFMVNPFKYAKLNCCLLLSVIITVIIYATISMQSWIKFFEMMVVFVMVFGVIFTLLKPLEDLLVEPRKLDTKLKGNHYERND